MQCPHASGYKTQKGPKRSHPRSATPKCLLWINLFCARLRVRWKSRNLQQNLDTSFTIKDIANPKHRSLKKILVVKFILTSSQFLRSWKRVNSFCTPRQIVRYFIQETPATLLPVHCTPKDLVQTAQKLFSGKNFHRATPRRNIHSAGAFSRIISDFDQRWKQQFSPRCGCHSQTAHKAKMSQKGPMFAAYNADSHLSYVYPGVHVYPRAVCCPVTISTVHTPTLLALRNRDCSCSAQS